MNKLYHCYHASYNAVAVTFQTEEQLLAQLQAAISYNERVQKDDEWAAVTGLMLMHYEAAAPNVQTNRSQTEEKDWCKENEIDIMR